MVLNVGEPASRDLFSAGPPIEGEPVDLGVSRPLTLADVERAHIKSVLASVGGSISAAARVLGLHRRTLQRKLRKNAPRTP